MFQFKHVAEAISVPALMLLASASIAATGDLDPDFADMGRFGPTAELRGQAWSLELLPDGSSLVSGGRLAANYHYQSFVLTNFVARVDAAGARDHTWNAESLEAVEVRDAALQPDGKLLAVGRKKIGSRQFTLVAFRLQSDGSLDPGFGTAGIVELSTASYPGSHMGTSVALEPDGRIVIAGYMDGEMLVLRLLADGGLDDTFGDAGVYHEPAARHGVGLRIVHATAGGYRIMAAGSGCRIVAFTATGAIDAAYGTSGIVELESSPGEPLGCGSLAAQADGRLLVAGGTGEAGVAMRLLESGARDPSFVADARVASVLTGATAVLARENGSILLGGSSVNGAAILRLQVDGTLDASFGKGGVTELDLPSDNGSQPVILDLVVGTDGTVLAAGGEHQNYSAFVIRLLGDSGGESAGVLGLSLPYLEASEEEQEVVVNVRRTGGSDGSVSVAYQTTPGSATVGEDYEAVTGVLTWADGDSDEKQIVVPITNAGTPEEFEDFRVTLLDVQGGAGSGTMGGTVAILPDGSPAGQFAIYDGGEVREGETIEMWVYRNFYGAGEVSVTLTPTSGTAIVGEDLEGQPLVLTWADQDYEGKPVTVRIVDDSNEEQAETFTMELSNATGGAVVGPYAAATYTIARNDISDTGGTGGGSSGGGGASTLSALLALLTLLIMRHRRATTAPSATRLAVALSLMLLGAAPAWAGRGDLDPNYGEGGRLAGSCCYGVFEFPLTGDRLLISHENGGNLGVYLRMVDATGKPVPSFGDGGVLVIDSSARARTFQALAAALAPNGDIVFLGTQNGAVEQTLLRVDSNGEPVPSFGTDGDGFVVLNITTTTRVITIDPDGRIVVVGSSVDAGNNCVTTARLQRLLADGQPDAAFGGDGLVEIPELNTCDGTTVYGARADGSVIVGDDDSTIVAVDTAGEIDPAFGTEGRFQVSGLASARSLLLPDGSLLVFGSSTDTGASDTVFRKYDRNGQPDLAFGSGSGSVTVDLGTAFLGESSAREVIDQLALDPDGEHVVAELSLFHADESLACSGIARLAIDGTPDATFGRNGLTCLNFYSAVIAVQSDGAPLVYLGYQDYIGRLLPDNTPSPGLLRVSSGRVDVDESAGTATLTIERLAGRDGAVSANFTTTDRRVRHCSYYSRTCWFSDGAAASSDYTSTSGRLDWADGDDGERTITVSILDDAIQEKAETFGVDISEPNGGVLLIVGSSTLYINDNDTATAPPPDDDPSPPPPPGGAGSVSWTTPLALLTLLLIRRRRVRSADQPRH